jgi:hypothetical protein
LDISAWEMVEDTLWNKLQCPPHPRPLSRDWARGKVFKPSWGEFLLKLPEWKVCRAIGVGQKAGTGFESSVLYEGISSRSRNPCRGVSFSQRDQSQRNRLQEIGDDRIGPAGAGLSLRFRSRTWS